jgi:hypothetical protein
MDHQLGRNRQEVSRLFSGAALRRRRHYSRGERLGSSSTGLESVRVAREGRLRAARPLLHPRRAHVDEKDPIEVSKFRVPEEGVPRTWFDH